MASLADLIFLKPPKRPLPPSLASQRDLIMLGPNTPASLVPPEMPEGYDDDPVLAAQQRARTRAYEASRLLSQQNAVDPFYEASRNPPDPAAKLQYGAIQDAASKMGWTNLLTGINDAEGVRNPTPGISGPPAAELAARAREQALDAYTQQKLGIRDSTYAGVKGLAQAFGSLLNPVDPETGLPNVALGAVKAGKIAPEVAAKLAEEAPGLLEKVLAETKSVDRIIPARTEIIKPSSRIVIPKGLTPEAIMAEAARDKVPTREGYTAFREANPGVEENIWDLLKNTEAIPEMTGQPARNRGVKGPLAFGYPTSARVAAATSDPSVERQIMQNYEVGKEALKKPWYSMSEVYKDFIKEHGPVKGPAEFLKQMDYFAATSPSSTWPTNTKIGSLYRYMDVAGIPLPDTFTKGYGSKYWDTHLRNVGNVRGGTFDPLRNPKTTSFSANLSGNLVPATIDIHNMRAIGQASGDPAFLNTKGRQELAGGAKLKDLKDRADVWADAPAENEYGPLEAWQQMMARKAGENTGTFQGYSWVGGGEQTGLRSSAETAAATLAARIAFTAARMGVKPDVIRTLWVRGKIPLLGAAGAASYLGSQPATSEPAQ